MANYNIKNCLSADTYVVSATSLTIGQVISFNIGETAYCGTVLSETEDPITPLSLYGVNYSSCCQCLISTSGETGIVSFRFNNCDNLSSINIDINTFCSQYGTVPTADRVFKFYDYQDSELIYLCTTSAGGSETPGTSSWEPSSEAPFSSCSNCIASEEGPFSSNTEYFMCLVCSGETSSISVPHAIYSDGSGRDVIQLNTVALGGPNGLYN